MPNSCDKCQKYFAKQYKFCPKCAKKLHVDPKKVMEEIKLKTSDLILECYKKNRTRIYCDDFINKIKKISQIIAHIQTDHSQKYIVYQSKGVGKIITIEQMESKYPVLKSYYWLDMLKDRTIGCVIPCLCSCCDSNSIDNKHNCFKFAVSPLDQLIEMNDIYLKLKPYRKEDDVEGFADKLFGYTE